MNGAIPLLGAIYVVVGIAIGFAVTGDKMTTLVGVLVAVMLLCTSAIIFAIDGARGRGGSL